MSTPCQALFAICVFLFLTIGANARLCIHCAVAIPGVPCRYTICEVDEEETCIGLITYKNEKVIDKVLGCAKKDRARCDISESQKRNIITEFKCCHDTDFCNAIF